MVAQRARQQIMRYRQLDHVDLAALDVGERLAFLEHDAVIAVGEVADDQRGGVDAAGGGDRQGVHVGHGHAVELAGGVLVDRLDIVVDLRDVDRDAVFVGPFLHDAGFGRIGPRHPADIDRPRDVEFLFRRGPRQETRAEGDHQTVSSDVMSFMVQPSSFDRSIRPRIGQT